MGMNYNKLWKLLIDRGLYRKDLREMAGISTNALAKMGKVEMFLHKCWGKYAKRLMQKSKI